MRQMNILSEQSTRLIEKTKMEEQMRLVIDCFKQVKGAGKSIGIYNLARHLVWELAGNHSSRKNAQNEIIVLGNAYNKKDFDVAGVTFIEIQKNPFSKLTCIKWELFDVSVLAKKLGADKVLFPRGYASMLHLTKEYVIIHDMIPFYYNEHYKGYFNRLENFYIMWRLKASAKHADKVITISEASKRDIMKYAHTDDKRITVVYNGYTQIENTQFIKKETDAEGDGDYIIAMTSKLPHKNAKGIAKAYACYRKAASTPLPMTVIGVEGVETEGITWIGYVERDEDLHQMLHNAKAFLFLSLVEGFGFPPIEAMQLETPVVCSGVSSLPEVVGDAALLVNPHDANAVAQALIRVTTDDAYAQELVERGLHNAERFNWEKTGDKYREVLFDEI